MGLLKNYYLNLGGFRPGADMLPCEVLFYILFYLFNSIQSSIKSHKWGAQAIERLSPLSEVTH